MPSITTPDTEHYGPPEPYHCACGQTIPGDYEFCGSCLGFDDDLDAAAVAVIPPCDLARWHHPADPNRPATVDGLTTSGPWANMCGPCHARHGVGLGAGRGQRLVLTP